MAFNANVQLSGQGTMTVGIPETNTFIVDGKLTVPALTEGSAQQTQVVATVKKNGSTMYTSNPGDRGFHVPIPCVANDVISIVISSSVASETRMRTTVAIG